MSGRPPGARGVERLVALYRIALHALPGSRRARFGASMEADARRLIGDAWREGGASAAARCVARESADVVRSGLVERGREAMGGWGMDLRYSMRSLAARPGFAAVATLTLGVAIGACTTVLSVVDAVLVRDLPYPEPSRLVRLVTTHRGGREDASVSYPDAMDVEAASHSLSDVVVYRPWGATLSGAGAPERLDGLMFAHGFLDMLGIEPALGRGFLPEEDVDGHDRVVVLSHGFWVRRFGADPGVIGRSLVLDGEPHVVVGVGPERFARTLPGFAAADVWRPLGLVGVPEDDLPYRGNVSYWAVARIAEGAAAAEADAELARITRRLEEEHPDTNTGQGMRVVPVHDLAVAATRGTLLMFLAAVAFVLAVGIANVAGLFLGRAIEREHEVALRSALGARRGRILRQLLVESLLVAGAGVGLGAALAGVGTDAVVSLAGNAIPLSGGVHVDTRVLSFAALAGLVAAAVTGLLPGLGLMGSDLLDRLRDGSQRTAGGTASRLRLRRILLVGQLSLTVLLAIGAGLLLRSFSLLSEVDPGVRDDLLTFRLELPSAGYDSDEAVAAFYRSVDERLARVRGVEEVAFTTGLPLTSRQACGTLYGLDDPDRFAGEDRCSEVRAVSPGYFRLAGIALRRGRTFDDDDTADSDDVVVVNEATAELLWPGVDPLGRELATGLGGRTHRVVGVVADVKQFHLDEPAPPQTYLPLTQWVRTGRNAVVRATGDRAALVAALQDAVWEVDANVPLTEIGTIGDFADATLARPRFRTTLVTAFALVALLISLAGVYGVVSYAVASRRREMAIRLSLGAARAEVVSIVVGGGMRDAALGVVVGLVGAFALSRTLESMLFGVSRIDPVAFAATPIVVLAVSAAASLVPALRVTRVDPVEALRRD